MVEFVFLENIKHTLNISRDLRPLCIPRFATFCTTDGNNFQRMCTRMGNGLSLTTMDAVAGVGRLPWAPRRLIKTQTQVLN